VTLAFFAYRKGTFKVVGSLVQAALERGHRVVLLWDPDESKPGEAVTEADLAAWPGARVVRFARRAPLLPVLRAETVEALCAPALYPALVAEGHEAEISALRQAGVCLYSLEHFFDNRLSAPDVYRAIDTTFYWSEHLRRLHWRVMADGFARLTDVDRAARSAVCGSTMLDQLALVDRAAVRKRYGLGDDQPVVVLMSLKMAVPEPWRRLVWGGRPRLLRAARAVAEGRAGLVPAVLRGNGYRDLVAATRDFCRRHGAALLVKSRRKNDDPRFLTTLSDALVFDESVYPYTSIELLAIADLCIHFQSGAVLEAAFAGVPSLSVVPPQEHLSATPGFDELFGTQPGSPQNFPGVVWSVPHAEAPALLRGARLAHFALDREARRRYVTIYAGFDDTRSSVRVLETIERAAR
jgi:hypothetical protein